MGLTYLIFLAILFGLIGAVIGGRKNRSGAGFFFGLLLGPIGWLLVAAGPDHRPATARPPAPPLAPSSAADNLLDLKKLLDAGVITQAEFDAKKKTLLEKL